MTTSNGSEQHHLHHIGTSPRPLRGASARLAHRRAAGATSGGIAEFCHQHPRRSLLAPLPARVAERSSPLGASWLVAPQALMWTPMSNTAIKR